MLFLTRDSAACTTDTTVRRERHQEMISGPLRCSGEKCHACSRESRGRHCQETFHRQNQPPFKPVNLADYDLLLYRLECGETQRADLDPPPLAKRRCRGLGGKLSAGSTRPRHRSERAPSQAISGLLHSLLPRRPHPPQVEQGDAEPQSSFGSTGSCGFSRATRRPAPPMQPCSVNGIRK